MFGTSPLTPGVCVCDPPRLYLCVPRCCPGAVPQQVSQRAVAPKADFPHAAQCYFCLEQRKETCGSHSGSLTVWLQGSCADLRDEGSIKFLLWKTWDFLLRNSIMMSVMQGDQTPESYFNEEELFVFNSKVTWRTFLVACGREAKITSVFCYDYDFWLFL